jgi:mRNA interferase MazF
MIADWQESGLLKLSVIKPVITTMQKDLVINKLGKLTHTDLQALKALLGYLLKP